MNAHLILAGLVALIAAAGGGYLKGMRDSDAAWQVKTTRAASIANEAARTTERKQQGEADVRTDQLKQERDAIQSRLDAALVGLRERAYRLPDTARTDCAGSSGRELSGADAGFLEREAARADRLRAALMSCYAHVDAVE